MQYKVASVISGTSKRQVTMTRTSLRPIVLLLAASGVLLAQQTPVDPQSAPPSNGGWRRMSDPAPAPEPAAQEQSSQPQDPSQPAARDAYGQMQQPQPAPRPPAAQAPRPAYGLPAQVTLKPGTFVTMRINQALASNHNAAGDTFSGTLTQPVVLNGIVVAQRGQMVYGRVAEAQKVKGVSRLGVELTSITLADGSQVQLHTQLISRQGPRTPGGEQAGVITTTTAGGAVVGAIAGGGTGAAAGAGIGAAAGIIGVLATRNHPSVIYPETLLTFQTENAVTIETGNSTGAFRYVGPDDYNHPATQVVQQAPPRRTYVYGPGYYPYYDPFYYPYWGWGGPSVFIGGGFRFGGGHFGGRRFR
jgi:hypothetical protein